MAAELARLIEQASPDTVALVEAILTHDVDDRRWAAQVGPALSQRDTARLLDKSEQAVSKDRRLLRIRNRDGRPVYPAVQFDGRRPLPGVAEVLDALGEATAPIEVLAWLTGRLPSLDDRRPVDVLRAGDVDAVVAAAQRFAALAAA